MQPFSCILLAGGLSSRMGRDKALLQLPDTTDSASHDVNDLLQHMMHLAQLSGAQQVVVSRDPSLRGAAHADYQFVADQFPRLGPLAGLHACLPQCHYERVLVLPVDMPLLSVGLLTNLASSTTSSYFAGYEMPCLLYRSDALQHFLSEQLTSQTARRSVRSLLHWLDAEALPIPSHTIPSHNIPSDTIPSGNNEFTLMNTNSPSDWQMFIELRAQQRSAKYRMQDGERGRSEP